MHIDEQLDTLKKIKQVEVPEAIYGHITRRISAFAPAPKTWKLSLAVAATLIILFNLGMILKLNQFHKNDSGLEKVGNILGLSTSNDLYNEQN